jgi:hypothetical protein
MIELGFRAGKSVRRGRQAQFLRGKPSDAFAVHRQMRRTRARNHRKTFLLEPYQLRSSDGFDLGDDQVRPLRGNDAAQRRSIQHVHDMAAVSHLHRRRVVIPIDHDDLDAETLQLDDDFLSELSAPAQQDAGC